MEFIINRLRAIKQKIFESIYDNKQYISLDKAIFSFTFDDVPVSAYTNGAKILESAEARGTYYVALGMNGNKNNSSEKDNYFNEKIIKQAYEKGHNIACHTYSHLNLRKHTAKYITKDCEKNTSYLSSMVDNAPISHFSYPFGKVSLRAKKALRDKYKTMRTIEHGINNGLTDMTHLRAISLTSESLDRNKIVDVINKTIQEKAWTIFFTHDVDDSPSEWGISIADFKWIVDKCSESDASILTVQDAYKIISEK